MTPEDFGSSLLRHLQSTRGYGGVVLEAECLFYGRTMFDHEQAAVVRTHAARRDGERDTRYHFYSAEVGSTRGPLGENSFPPEDAVASLVLRGRLPSHEARIAPDGTIVVQIDDEILQPRAY